MEGQGDGQNPEARWAVGILRLEDYEKISAPWNWLGTNQLEAKHQTEEDVKKNVYLCITESLCRTAEINQLYFNSKENFRSQPRFSKKYIIV